MDAADVAVFPRSLMVKQMKPITTLMPALSFFLKSHVFRRRFIMYR
jgi:hypothetical protein